MRSTVLRCAFLAALAVFYVMAATEHAERINTFKARGDQSGYLWDGQNVYHNWHGANPPILIGERNRMPLYAGFLAAFWSPAMSNDEFFARAKIWNIYLSLGLLAVLAGVFAYDLPPLPATNLTMLVAFGYYVFKAGYTQSELLFYTLFFLAFLLLWRLFLRPADAGAALLLSVAAGAVMALAHLTKAALLPLVAVVLAASVATERKRLWTALVVVAAFLVTLSPYLRENKKAFGQYFYNVNTTFYIWYDDWPHASRGTHLYGDGVGWPKMPPDQLPSAARYWREHTVSQIAERIAAGFRDMLDRSYKTFWYWKYVLLYVACAFAVVLKKRKEVADLVRRHRAASIFLMLYAGAYLLGIAFYAPISGTGTTRFIIAHLTPFFFVLSQLLSSETVRDAEWQLAGRRITVANLHQVIFVSLAFDIAFVIWPRLMTTYGGF
jgi:hypothetical protein